MREAVLKLSDTIFFYNISLYEHFAKDHNYATYSTVDLGSPYTMASCLTPTIIQCQETGYVITGQS